MYRKRNEVLMIDDNLPEGLRWLLDVNPIPRDSDARCSKSGVCATLAWSGVTCGALFSKCALLPIVKREVVDGKGAVVENEFEGFLNGVRMRHPEFFNVKAEVPTTTLKTPPVAKITPLPLNLNSDWQMKAAGDEWDGVEDGPEGAEVVDGN